MHDGTETVGWGSAATGIADLSILSHIFLIV
jgi:hypothetical protein